MYIDVRGVYPILVNEHRVYTLPHTQVDGKSGRNFTVDTAPKVVTDAPRHTTTGDEKRRDTMIARYRDRLAYWSGQRVSNSFQTPEFIAAQIHHCAQTLASL